MAKADVSLLSLKSRQRGDYPFLLSYPTRWSAFPISFYTLHLGNSLYVCRSDNDQYAHINNSIYYHLFDSIVNTYLIQHARLSPTSSPHIGLVVSSHAHFFSPLSFPDVVDLYLRVMKLGSSSVTYEIAVFARDANAPSVVGGYTHVFVDRTSRKSAPISDHTRAGLEKLLTQLPSARL